MAHAGQPAPTDPTTPPGERPSGGRGSARVGLMVVAAGVGVIPLVVGGYVVWDRNWRPASSATPPADCPVIAPAGPRRPLAMPGVHRVTLIGDSIMKQAG